MKKKRQHWSGLWSQTNEWYADEIKAKAEIIVGLADSRQLSATDLAKLCCRVKVGGRWTESRYPTAGTIAKILRIGRGEETPSYTTTAFVYDKILAVLGVPVKEVRETVETIVREQIAPKKKRKRA